jgi:nucleotide-binding universal stress UspA family protein
MFKKILIPVDPDMPETWSDVAETAGKMADAFGSELHAISVVTPPPAMEVPGYIVPADYSVRAADTLQPLLEKLIAGHPAGQHKVNTHIAHGVLHSKIVDLAKEIGADLILMSSHEPEFADFLFGANASRVVRHFEGSVLVLRQGG